DQPVLVLRNDDDVACSLSPYQFAVINCCLRRIDIFPATGLVCAHHKYSGPERLACCTKNFLMTRLVFTHPIMSRAGTFAPNIVEAEVPEVVICAITLLVFVV